jgi:hypothetical protein
MNTGHIFCSQRKSKTRAWNSTIDSVRTHFHIVLEELYSSYWTRHTDGDPNGQIPFWPQARNPNSTTSQICWRKCETYCYIIVEKCLQSNRSSREMGWPQNLNKKVCMELDNMKATTAQIHVERVAQDIGPLWKHGFQWRWISSRLIGTKLIRDRLGIVK